MLPGNCGVELSQNPNREAHCMAIKEPFSPPPHPQGGKELQTKPSSLRCKDPRRNPLSSLPSLRLLLLPPHSAHRGKASGRHLVLSCLIYDRVITDLCVSEDTDPASIIKMRTSDFKPKRQCKILGVSISSGQELSPQKSLTLTWIL